MYKMYEYKLWYKLFVFSLHFYMLSIFTLVYTIYTWYTRIIEQNSLTVYWSIGVFSRYFYLHSIWRYLNICSEGASMYLLNYFYIILLYYAESSALSDLSDDSWSDSSSWAPFSRWAITRRWSSSSSSSSSSSLWLLVLLIGFTSLIGSSSPW